MDSSAPGRVTRPHEICSTTARIYIQAIYFFWLTGCNELQHSLQNQTNKKKEFIKHKSWTLLSPKSPEGGRQILFYSVLEKKIIMHHHCTARAHRLVLEEANTAQRISCLSHQCYTWKNLSLWIGWWLSLNAESLSTVCRFQSCFISQEAKSFFWPLFI